MIETDPKIPVAGQMPNAAAGDAAAACCGADAAGKRDWLLTITAGLLVLALIGWFSGLPEVAGWEALTGFCQAVAEILGQMWWGVLLGVVFVGLLNLAPRELVLSALRPGGAGGVMRAAAAGLAFDLCSHGILLIAAKLYERGASLGQVIAFLIASPWNSLSLTVILASLIGWGWTFTLIGLSFIVAVITGLIFERLGEAGVLPRQAEGAASPPAPVEGGFWASARAAWRSARWDGPALSGALRSGAAESGMVLRWLFLGVLLAAALRIMMDEGAMAAWFGPTLAGLGLTLLAATVIEVCSEGSAPIAADLFNRAGAPGNGFAFLMAGAATDYTEIMVLRQATSSWRAALFMPLIAVPQIILLGFLLNQL